MKKKIAITLFLILYISAIGYCSEMVYPLTGHKYRPVVKKTFYAELAGSSSKTTYDPVIDNFRVVEWELEVSTLSLFTAFDATDKISVNITLPYVEAERSNNLGNTFTGSGIGDISAGIKYQLLNSQELKGDIFFLLNASFPTGKGSYETDGELATGSGGYSLKPEITIIRKLNDAFPFCSLSYQYNFEKDNLSYSGLSGGEAGISLHKVKPGASYGIRFGFVELLMAS